MAFKNVVSKLRRALSCCSKRGGKRSLEIGSPTDVRRVDISDALPGLTDIERRYIREKASSDAIHLIGLRSTPPSHPATLASTPMGSRSPSLAPTSVMSSREPSIALLNAASNNLPSALPTPPRRTHHENSPPGSRMKGMWTSSKRLSNSSTCHDGLYEKLDEIKGADVEEKDLKEPFMTLNLNFDFEEKTSMTRSETPRTVSLAEGFEVQDTKGGNGQPVAKNLVIRTAVEETQLDDSTDDSDDSDFEDGSLLSNGQTHLLKI